MRNRRENRNTRKARIYQFTQQSYRQNRKATITKILEVTLSLENESSVTPPVFDVEAVYTGRLEKGNQSDNSATEYPPPQNSSQYDRIGETEVRTCRGEMNRKTASGLDLAGIAELNQLTDKQISMIFNRWWGLVIPDTAKECKTTLLPKTIEDREDVGNWRPITIGNVLMRLYAKVWDKRLRDNIKLDDRQKGSVPVHGCYENVKIMKQQRKRRREYNIVFLDLVKPFDSVSHQSLRNGLRKKGIPQTVVEGIMEMYYHSTTRISIGGRKTKRLNINSGVKQGCPVSIII